MPRELTTPATSWASASSRSLSIEAVTLFTIPEKKVASALKKSNGDEEEVGPGPDEVVVAETVGKIAKGSRELSWVSLFTFATAGVVGEY